MSAFSSEAMTGKHKTAREALDRLADALVEDIMSASDEDILAEMRETEGAPESHAADMRALFEKSLISQTAGESPFPPRAGDTGRAFPRARPPSLQQQGPRE